MIKTIILYEPQFNFATTYQSMTDLANILNIDISAVSTAVKNKRKLRNFNCYVFDRMPGVAEKRRLIAGLKFNDEQWREWKDSGLYVSNKGRFRSTTKTGHHYYFVYKHRHNNGYLIKYNTQSYRANRIVYETWIGEIPEGHRVMAKNGIRHEITADNLKCVSVKELGERTGAKAKSRAVVLLDDNNELIDEYNSARKVARMLPISHEAVRNKCNNRHINSFYNFMWADEYYREEGDDDRH